MLKKKFNPFNRFHPKYWLIENAGIESGKEMPRKFDSPYKIRIS